MKTYASSFSIILIAVCLTIVGLFLLPELSVKLSPSKTLPQISVQFAMPGSSPRIVEIETTSKLEAMLNRIKGVRSITSSSDNGSGKITLEFDKHTNIENARFEVSTIIRQAWSSLPSNVSYPSITVSQADNRNQSFLNYTVNAPLTPTDIQEYVENNIRPKLAHIEGIHRIDVYGATGTEYHILYDYRKLEAHKVSHESIEQAIEEQLQQEFLGLGRVSVDETTDQWMRVLALPVAYDLGSIQIKAEDGKIINLDQLAEIVHVEAEPQRYFRVNGLNSIYLSIVAEDNANQLTLAEEIKDEIEALSMSFSPGYQIHLNYDSTDYIKEELAKIYFRTGLTLLILLLFVLIAYRSLKYTLMVIISVVVNIFAAVIFYYLFQVEIQLYSLAGITISITLIIDNTIVMADQIIKRKNILAFFAILTATLTTIIALSVIFFLDEKTRLNLIDFAIVLIINLSLSLIVALFLVPALMEKLKISEKKRIKKHGGRRAWLIRLNYHFNHFYLGLCRIFYRRKGIVITLLILAFGIPVFMLPDEMEGDSRFAGWYNATLGSDTYTEGIKPYVDKALGGTLRLFVEDVYEGSYYADREETNLYITASLPNYYTLEQMNNLVKGMESYLSQFEEISLFQTNISSPRQASINVQFKKEHQRTAFPHVLKANVISKSLTLGGGSWGVYGFGDGFSNDVREGAGSYRVEMFGYNYDELMELATIFKQELIQHRRINDVNIRSEFSWYKDDYEEYNFDIDNEKLAYENIAPINLYAQLNTIFNSGAYVEDLFDDDKRQEVYLKSAYSEIYNIWDLNNTPVFFNDRYYKLSDLAVIKREQTPNSVVKVDQQYRLCLQYEYIGAAEQGKKVLERAIDDYEKQLPMGYTIANADQQNLWGKDSNKQYVLLLLIFIVIYFTTSILFNSFRQPLCILFVVPISFIGIFLTFYLFELNFDQGGFASFILLSGITINANIYILDEYNTIRSRFKIARDKAYIKAWNAKIRPVLLTIVSTILGFIPFLIGDFREGFWFPLAAGTIGGLVVSLIAIFLFLPLFMGVGRKKQLYSQYKKS
ncbi:efflux RND transporter permease subunit [Albibacterium indicum]|uniref:efflux RND transporter permease subunit n=1 Tax=Albibacterium indicum TaxID=2292082 RepID=UPI000E4F9DB9|nr:efflux RND transporter permease subunit [Pedobacter indicus]